MKPPYANIPETLRIIQIVAAYWPDADAAYLIRWAAPILKSCPAAISREEIERAIAEIRDVPLEGSVRQCISDAEFQRREDNTRAAARAARQDEAERAVMRDSSPPRRCSGGVIDISDRY